MKRYMALAVLMAGCSIARADALLDQAKRTFREKAATEEQRHKDVLRKEQQAYELSIGKCTNALLNAYSAARQRARQNGKAADFDKIAQEEADFLAWWDAGGMQNPTGWLDAGVGAPLAMIWLTDVTPDSTSEEMLANEWPKTIKKKPPTVDGKPIERFLYATAPRVLRFPIKQGMNHFSAIGGSAGISATVKFKVVVDKKVVYESPTLTDCPDRLARMEVDLPERSKLLELIVDDCGDNEQDFTFWAEPALKRLRK